MRKTSVILTVALVTGAALALAFGTGSSSSAAPAAPVAQGGQDVHGGDPSGGPGPIDPSRPMPANHPAMHGIAKGLPRDAVHGFAGAHGGHAPKELAWKAPDGWVPAPNPSPMRLATYTLPRTGGDKEDTELSVVVAGGDVEANVARWAGQFTGADAPKETQKAVRDLPVTLVEVDGTYQGGMGESTAPHEGWALLGAIVKTKGPSGQSYFFKVIGPAATVHAAREPFEAMIDSITPM